MFPDDISFKNDNQRDEKDDRVHIVIKAELPTIIIDARNHLLRVDTVERNEQRRKYTKHSS